VKASCTAKNAELKELIGQIRPSTWELLQAIVDKGERRILQKILALAGAGRGRREQDDGAQLLEMARLRQADRNLSVRAAAAQVLRKYASELPNAAGGESIYVPGRVISKESYQNNLVKKYGQQEQALQRHLADEATGRAVAARVAARHAPIPAVRPPQGTAELLETDGETGATTLSRLDRTQKAGKDPFSVTPAMLDAFLGPNPEVTARRLGRILVSRLGSSSLARRPPNTIVKSVRNSRTVAHQPIDSPAGDTSANSGQSDAPDPDAGQRES
jgi:hypothetical protein